MKITSFILMGLSLAFVTTGCDSPEWFGSREGPRLPGERISVLRLEQSITPDPELVNLPIELPPPWKNLGWLQLGGVASHAMHHLELGEGINRRWAVDIGRGSDDENRLLAQPVVSDGRIYVMDSASNVSAFSFDTGNKLWTRNLVPNDEEEGAIGGGIAFSDGRLFVTTGYGYIYALAPETGYEEWSQNVGIPFRGAPTAAGGRVFTITYDNQLRVFASDNGRQLWSHTGLPEEAGLIGAPSVAVSGGIALVPYSSGEIYALRVENGREVWSDQLIKSVQITALSAMSEIQGSPVVDRGMVIAVSYSGRIAAIDIQNGRRIWELDLKGIETPWVAGDFVYLVTTRSEVVCLNREDGRIRWVSQLERYEDPDSLEDAVHWSGPVLGSDRLILASTNGSVVSVSPYTGKQIGLIKLEKGIGISPVIAGKSLLILTQDAKLLMFD